MSEAEKLAICVHDVYDRGDIPLPLVVKAECQRRGVPYDGDMSLALEPLNLVLLTAVSQQACDIAEEIRQCSWLTVEASSIFVYAYEGAPIIAGLPLAKKPPKGGYKTPHWTPVVVIPAVENKGEIGGIRYLEYRG